MDKTVKLLFAAFIFATGAYFLWLCINSGPCGNICGYVPSWLSSLLPCRGAGTGSGNASQSTLNEFDQILNNLEQQTGTTPGCTGSDCTPDVPGQSSGMLSIGG